jgi:hypothetical protein
MNAPTRRHRSSDKPIGRHRTIEPHEIDERYIEVLRRLEPYYHFKFATIPWLHYLSNVPISYSVFRKYLGYLRQAPNRYLACPEQQIAAPNADRKTLVYELAERGLNELIGRGIVLKRQSCFRRHPPKCHCSYRLRPVQMPYSAARTRTRLQATDSRSSLRKRSANATKRVRRAYRNVLNIGIIKYAKRAFSKKSFRVFPKSNERTQAARLKKSLKLRISRRRDFTSPQRAGRRGMAHVQGFSEARDDEFMKCVALLNFTTATKKLSTGTSKTTQHKFDDLANSRTPVSLPEAESSIRGCGVCRL